MICHQSLYKFISCYVGFVGLLLDLIFHKTNKHILYFVFPCLVCFVIVSTLVFDIFWRQFLRIFYSFEPLCYKPCCLRYSSGLSQSSVLSTNIQSACFQKSLLYRQNQWKMVRKALCWVEFIEKIGALKTSVQIKSIFSFSWTRYLF